MTRRYQGPQGKLQRRYYDQAKAKPSGRFNLPDGIADRAAVRRMAEKGLLELVDDGARYRLAPRPVYTRCI